MKKQSNSITSLMSEAQFTASPTGLQIAEGVDYDAWQNYGGKLRAVQGALQWAIGDWLNYGEAHYGETYAQALELWPEHAYGTLANYKYVAGKVEFSWRHENLSFSHHQEVARLYAPLRREFLDRAAAEGWTSAELRAAVSRENGGPAQIEAAPIINPDQFGTPDRWEESGEWQAHEFVAPPAPELLETPTALPHVAHNSGENEWYTPPEYLEAARAVMGGIDCDPASSDIANQTVKAKRYYTKADNGLEQRWRGRVWMNPPYASDLIGAFCDKLISEYVDGGVTEAIVLVNNATETQWFGNLVGCAKAIVFTRGRVRFLDPQGRPGAPLQGQAVIYLGDKAGTFVNVFKQFGWQALL